MNLHIGQQIRTLVDTAISASPMKKHLQALQNLLSKIRKPPEKLVISDPTLITKNGKKFTEKEVKQLAKPLPLTPPEKEAINRATSARNELNNQIGGIIANGQKKGKEKLKNLGFVKGTLPYDYLDKPPNDTAGLKNNINLLNGMVKGENKEWNKFVESEAKAGYEIIKPLLEEKKQVAAELLGKQGQQLSTSELKQALTDAKISNPEIKNAITKLLNDIESTERMMALDFPQEGVAPPKGEGLDITLKGQIMSIAAREQNEANTAASHWKIDQQ